MRSSPPARRCAHAIGDASRLIALGDADVMLAGGTESPDMPAGDGGVFARRAHCRPASTRPPEKASRPYDRDRDGFVMGEGDGRRGARRVPARESARREGFMPRVTGLRHVRRRLSYHLAITGRRWRVSQHERRHEARRHHGFRNRLQSMRTARRRSSATKSSLARWSGCWATPPRGYRCRRPNHRQGICSARPAPSKPSSVFLRFATTSLRQRSISTIPRWKPRSIWCR